MEETDSNIKKVIQIVLITGLAGAIILTFINFTSFQKDSTHSSLLILTFVLIIVSSLILNKFLNHHFLSYFKRVFLGFSTYCISLAILFIEESLFTSFYIHRTFSDLLIGLFQMLLFGFAVSLVSAIFVKTKSH